MGCTKSKGTRLDDKIAQVMDIYEQILNEIREKRQQYIGKCGDLDDTNHEDPIEYTQEKKSTLHTQQSFLAVPGAANVSTVMSSSKKSLEAAEMERKKSRADVWRFSNRNSFDVYNELPTRALRNKSIIKPEEFSNYMIFLKEISTKFEQVKSRQLALIEQYYNSDKKEIQNEVKRLHFKIEIAQKKKTEVENCLNKILNQEQFTPLPDGYYIVSHF